jgi:hypothetical protein
MRVWGRVTNQDGNKSWVEGSTTPNGNNSYVVLTWLIQVLKLNLNESPFYGDWGIPAHPSVVQQIAPDFYVTLTQQRFAPYFAALTVAKVPGRQPTYAINVTFVDGTKMQATVAV